MTKSLFKLVPLLIISVILSGCQLIPVKTVDQTDGSVKAADITPKPEPAVIATIDLSKEFTGDSPIIFHDNEKISFINTGSKSISLKLKLDTVKELSIESGGKFEFIYPSGFKEVGVAWDKNELVLERAEKPVSQN